MGEPLEEVYVLSDNDRMVQTGEASDAQSIVCDMGRAIEQSRNEEEGTANYSNAPIEGLKLELRARATLKQPKLTDFSKKTMEFPTEIIAMGYIVIVKNQEDIKVLPIGHYEDGNWMGDVLHSWPARDTDISVGRSNRHNWGVADIDLTQSKGLYHDFTALSGETDVYFLSNCQTVMSVALPVYEYETD